MEIELETNRLVLRPLSVEDVEPHIAFMSDDRVAQFLSLDQKPQSRAIAWRNFASMIGHWSIRGFGFFSCFEKMSGNWVGRVGPWMPETWPALEVGWGIAPDHWGKGFAPEAAIATMQWTFKEFPELTRIISLIDPANKNSQAVAQKIGESLTREIYDLEGMDLQIWEAPKHEWLSKFDLKP